MAEWTLEYPEFLGLVLLFLICETFCRAKARSLLFPNTVMLSRMARRTGWLQWLLKFIMVAALSVALASPVKQNEVIVNKDKGYELALILDASGSMRQSNKFAVVREIVQDFLDKREHDKLALTLFADFAYVAFPLTYDKKSLKDLLGRIDVGIAGMQYTSLYEALFMSSKLFEKSKSKHKIAILLTDGVDNISQVPLEVAINSAKKHAIKTYVIGVGGRGDYNPVVLRKIASETGGKFYEASTIAQLKSVYKEIDKLEKSEITANRFVKTRFYFQYPLGVALAALMLVMIVRRRGYAL